MAEVRLFESTTPLACALKIWALWESEGREAEGSVWEGVTSGPHNKGLQGGCFLRRRRQT